jgi:hypothetical protein
LAGGRRFRGDRLRARARCGCSALADGGGGRALTGGGGRALTGGGGRALTGGGGRALTGGGGRASALACGGGPLRLRGVRLRSRARFPIAQRQDNSNNNTCQKIEPMAWRIMLWSSNLVGQLTRPTPGIATCMCMFVSD